MQEFPYVLSECEEINLVLHKPIYSTQRIKYTCINVSPSYIILGSTSGSIYLFNREPCTFAQLIPLSEGIVSCVSISPDEKTIALATTRGTVCLVALKPTIKLISTSNEHACEQVTCLCWNDNSSEVYIGDRTGKVSVMVLSIFTVNGMFQSPSCPLMNLDSSIVQLNFSSPLLLVSTLTRCYMCDTVQEQYKQIGNKARNGEFGACFYKVQTCEKVKTSATKREDEHFKKKHSFNFTSENNSNVQEQNYPTIFCARPSSRLWEISATGLVLKTHQFKEALAVPPVEIFRTNASDKCIGFSTNKVPNESWTVQSVNFSHLFVISQKYLFSYTSNGLYILDPLSSTVVLWNNEFANISMAEVVENKIYLMTCNSEFHCLELCTIDLLILHLYSSKQYYDCMKVCLRYESQLRRSINNKYINDIFSTENNHRISQDNDLSALMHPLVSFLRLNLNTQPVRLESGIVVVHSGSSDLRNDENQQYKIVDQKNNELKKKQEEQTEEEELFEEEIIHRSEVKYTKTNHLCSEFESKLVSLNVEESQEKAHQNVSQQIQNDLEPVYLLADTINSSLCEKEIEQNIYDSCKKLKEIKETYGSLTELQNLVYELVRTAELHYFDALLKNTSTNLFSHTSNPFITKYFIEAFIEINSSDYKECVCTFPYPPNKLKEPKFLEAGKALLKGLSYENKNCIYLCNRVPYMWREYLLLYAKENEVLKDVLRQCLQTKDNIVLSIMLPLLNEDQWKSVGTYLTVMKEGRCLSCGKFISLSEMDSENTAINWRNVTLEVMKKLGPDTTMTFLTKLEAILPNESFDKSVFQSLIFTKILHHHGLQRTVDFNKSSPETREYSTMCSEEVRDQLVKVLEKDLGRTIDKNIFGNGAHHWGMLYNSKSSMCPCCTLSLQTPVLLGNNGIAIFPCGHTYHVNCMIEKKLSRCNLHL